jgi:23S rRNA (guanosine2251-2'-O)-methyltransferase
MAQYVYGKNVVKQILLDGTRAQEVYLTGQDGEIMKLAAARHVPVKFVDRRTLTKLVHNEHHNGCAARIEPYRTYSLDELLAMRKSRVGQGLLVLLDGLEDPHNLGAILRTCDAAGADGVIFRKNNAVGLTPTVAKASVGAIDTVPCAEVTNLARTCEILKERGWWIVGSDMNGQDYRSLNYDFDTVLVIGNEGKGISRLMEKECDYMVSLPMEGKIESLNASVSAGVLMYEIHSRRFPLPGDRR